MFFKMFPSLLSIDGIRQDYYCIGMHCLHTAKLTENLGYSLFDAYLAALFSFAPLLSGHSLLEGPTVSVRAREKSLATQ